MQLLFLVKEILKEMQYPLPKVGSKFVVVAGFHRFIIHYKIVCIDVDLLKGIFKTS